MPLSWPALILVAILLALPFQGTRGLLDPDEGRYTECAREMLQTGNFLTPQLGHRPHYTKPPLTYWLIAGSLSLFGEREWAVRLPTALAYGACILVVGMLATAFWNRRVGILAGLIYASFLTPCVAGNIVTPDTVLTLWEALALLTFCRGLKAGRARARCAWSAMTGAAFGLAFLTKGPPGLLFVPALTVLSLWRDRVPRQERIGDPPPDPVSARRLLFHPAGFLAFAVIGLSWILFEGARHEGLISYLIRDEVLGRMAGHHHRNAEWYGPLVVYLPTLLVGALPWSLTWPTLLARLSGAHRTRAAGILHSMLQTRTSAFLTVAIVFPLLVLSISRSRLPLYVLPLFVPLALATARGLDGLSSQLSGPSLRAAASWVVFLLAVRVGFALWPGGWDARALYRGLPLSGVEEVVVADHRPHYGLAFYWKGAILFTSVQSAYPAVASSPSLEEEVARQAAEKDTHLYLVRLQEAEALEELLARAGLTVREEREIGRTMAIVSEGARNAHATPERLPSHPSH